MNQAIVTIKDPNSASKQEVASLMSKIIEAFNQLKQSVAKENGSRYKECEDMCKKLEKVIYSMERDFKSFVKETDKKTQDKAYKDLNAEVYKLEKLISEVPQFDSSVLEKKWSVAIDEVHKKIADWKNFELRAVDVRDSLETLKNDERLDKSAVKGIEEIEKDISYLKSRPATVISGGRSGGTGFHRLTLNGVTKSFTIPNFKGGDVGVMGSSFPTVFAKTDDFTVNGNVLTFTDQIDAATTLASDQTVYVIYNQLFFAK